MARKKLNMITLHSWQECDAALRSIGENLRDIAAIENVMNEQIASAKAAATDKAAPLKEQVAELELALRDYAQTHRDDMDGRKSKLLTFGSVGFRRQSPGSPVFRTAPGWNRTPSARAQCRAARRLRRRAFSPLQRFCSAAGRSLQSRPFRSPPQSFRRSTLTS